MVNWTSLVEDGQIINVEPVVAEIRMQYYLFTMNIFLLLCDLAADATCQFTLILTGIKTGQVKVELPFKLDGIDDFGYLHVEAEIIVSFC